MALTGLTEATTVGAALIASPYLVTEPIPCAQVPAGINLLGRRETVNFDQFALSDPANPAKILTDRNMALIGHTGFGKSSWTKTHLQRMLDRPEILADGTERWRRAVIIDRKGEYRKLAEDFGCRLVQIGHGVCINPLDDRLTDWQQETVLDRFVGLRMHRPLEGFDLRCLHKALANARTDRDGVLTLDDVRRALMVLPADDGFVKDSLATLLEVNKVCRDLAFAIEHLTSGSLRGLFNGPTTDALDWTGQVVAIGIEEDYLRDDREHVYELLVACISVWLDRGWRANDDTRIDFLVIDEGWDVARARQFGQLLQDWTKLGRSHGVSVMLALQGASDYESAGDANSEQRAMARRALKEMGTFILFWMPREEAELLRDTAGLSDDDIDAIENLRPHQFLMVVGRSGMSRRRLMLGHILADHEVELVKSERDTL